LSTLGIYELVEDKKQFIEANSFFLMDGNTGITCLRIGLISSYSSTRNEF